MVQEVLLVLNTLNVVIYRFLAGLAAELGPLLFPCGGALCFLIFLCLYDQTRN